MNLEQQITAALGADIPSVELAALLQEVEQAIGEADANAEAARARSLDLTTDPEEVLSSLRRAELERDRLKAILPRLQDRYQRAADAERYAKWCEKFDPLIPRHAAAVENLRTVYTEVIPKLLAALTEAQAVDASVDAVMRGCPYDLPQTSDDGRRLPKVELRARGLKDIAQGHSLMTDLKLPTPDKPNELLWPPQQHPYRWAVDAATATAASTSVSEAFTSDWWKIDEQRDKRRLEALREEELYQREQQAKTQAAYEERQKRNRYG